MESKGEQTIFSEVFNQLLIDSGISVPDLSRSTGIPITTIRYMLNGIIKEPSPSKIQILANFFGVSADFLIGIETKKVTPLQEAMPSSESQKIPVLTIKDIKAWKMQKAAFLYPKDTQWIPVDKSFSKDAFAIKIDYSVKNAFFENSFLIFDPEIKFKDGSFILVSIKQGKPLLKKVHKEGDSIYYQSVRTRIPSVEQSKTDIVWGVLTEARKRL